VDRGRLGRRPVGGAGPPEAAETEDDAVAAGECAGCALELLERASGVAFELEGDALDDESSRARGLGGVEEVRPALPPGAVVRLRRAGGEVGEEVDDDLRTRVLRDAQEGLLVIDVAEGRLGAEAA
jgi:hypothetical protein